MTRARIVTLAALALFALAATLVLATGALGDLLERGGVGARGERLPDLEILAPDAVIAGVVTVDGERKVRLGFSASAENKGVGPLTITGHRLNTTTEFMTADQMVTLANGSSAVRESIGSLAFVEDPTHRHWHLLSFMSYELRRASDFKLVSPDQKTGFCLGDRYNVDPQTQLPAEPDRRVYNSTCGLEQTQLLEVLEGISVGWGDIYQAWRDQQFVDITGLPAGVYILVHRVNGDRALKESNYANNAASVRLRLTWPNGPTADPRVRVLRVCEATARCPVKKR